MSDKHKETETYLELCDVLWKALYVTREALQKERRRTQILEDKLSELLPSVPAQELYSPEQLNIETNGDSE